MITDRRKFATKVTLYGIYSFYFLPLKSIQSHSDGLYKKPLQIFCDVQRGLTARQITLTSLSRRYQSPSTIESRDTRPRRMQK